MNILPNNWAVINGKQRCFRLAASSIFFLGATATLGVDTVSAADNKQTAKLIVEAVSDSTGTIGKHYVINNYLDEECNKPRKGFKLQQKRYAKDQHEFRKINLNAGEEFLFQVNYKEELRSQTRECSFMVGFTPEPERAYKAIYSVTEQVSRCAMRISDITDASSSEGVAVKEPVEIAYNVPKHSCLKRKTKGNKNGVPTHALKDRLAQ